jgi:hypothetical protein
VSLRDVGLPVLAHVVETPELVRALENLEAAVLFGRFVERNEDRQHVRGEAAVVVPVAEILVPLPGTALAGCFIVILWL